LIFIKKIITKLKFFFQNQIGFGSVWFFRQKPVQTGLAQFFGLARFFSYLAPFFSVWFQFGSVFLVSGL
jgi:hypothetical protein